MRIFAEVTENVRGSVVALTSHRLRFCLSTLGIVIGISAVTLMGGAIESIRQSFRRSVSALYTDVLFLEQYPWFNDAPWWEFREHPRITIQEAESVGAQASFASEVVYEAKVDRDVTCAGQTAYGLAIVGTTDRIVPLRSITLQQGRFFTPLEVTTAQRVCVLGPAAVDALFPTGEAVGRMIRIDNDQYEVIGVTGRLGQFFGRTLDYQLFLPLTRFQADLMRDPALSVLLKIRNVEAMSDAREELRGMVRKIRRLQTDQKDNFAINEQEGALRTFQRTNATIAAAGLFITGLSLAVGTIGIANIMYVSVRERTREIGLRKALGARRRIILLQFLIEGLIVCVLGGVMAVALAYFVSGYLGQFQAIEMSANVLLISLLVAICAGILASFFPAWEASRMPPVEALRAD